MLPLNSILLGDCLDVLKTLPDASIDAVVTDVPYGLGTKEPTVEEIIAYLTSDAVLDTNGDFMGRDWSIPPVPVWKECYRVLKPGGHLLSFGGTRTFDLISLGIRAAGFENRDTVATQFGTTVLSYLHGQGFPKGVNISKALEKAGAAPEVVERWRGFNTALKPAWEPILVYRKPLSEGTVVAQVASTGTGGLNIDACRVLTDPDDPNHRPGVTTKVAESSSYAGFIGIGGARRGALPSGRWPANVILVHSEGCKIVGSKKVPAPVINRFDDGMKPFGDGAGHAYTTTQTGDADGMEEIPVYECEAGCAVSMLDEQSGVTRGLEPSRFFGQFQPDAPFFYTSKVSRSERNKGLAAKPASDIVVLRPNLTDEEHDLLSAGWSDDLPDWSEPINIAIVPYDLQGLFEPFEPEQNTHPTVKPLALMKWLVRLVCPKGGVVLDHYCGSGTTCIAALEADCHYIGIEKDPEARDTALKRIAGQLQEIEDRASDRGGQALLDALMAGGVE